MEILFLNLSRCLPDPVLLYVVWNMIPYVYMNHLHPSTDHFCAFGHTIFLKKNGKTDIIESHVYNLHQCTVVLIYFSMIVL